jgi:hypothetical protein
MSKDEALLDAEDKAASKIDKMTDIECRADLESRLIQEFMYELEQENNNEQ